MASKKTTTKTAPEKMAPTQKEEPKKLGRPAEVLKLTVGEAPPEVIQFANRLVTYVGDDGKLLIAIMQHLRQQERVIGILGVVNMLKRYGA
tara:strand:+ start:335 stop:607 length:273 start_codon:yes stop_codon:yes gene_type:complete